jgi:predicted nucleic acid-binding protein
LQIDIEKLVNDVDSHLDGLTRSLSPEMLAWLKENTEKHIGVLGGGKIEDLRISLVIDTNFALAAIRHYEKGKMPMLIKMAKNPLFPIYAPPELAIEVEEKLMVFAEEGLNLEKMQEAWKQIRAVIKFSSRGTKVAKKKAAELIGSKDKDDVPFVQVYIDCGAAAILTEDEHYDNEEIKTFTVKDLQKIVAMSHRGVFSFFILHDMTPMLLKLLWQAVLGIARAIFDLVALLAKLAAGVITGGIKMIADILSRLPDKVGVILLTAVLGAGIAALAIEKSRKKIISFAQDAWSIVKPILQKLSEWFWRAVEFAFRVASASKPYVGASLLILTRFIENVKVLREELQRISAAAA